MILKLSVTSFFDSLRNFYLSLPDADKLIVYIILILLFILFILLVIMLEQKRVSNKIIAKQAKPKEDIEVLDFDLGDTQIDENNEKTRNLKEITDKIQAVIDSRTIDLTKFEQDQEETSIISYNELMKSVGQKVEPPTEKFSLPNLVRKIEVNEELEHVDPYVTQSNENKFKSSVFISPVFGIQEPIRNNIIPKEEQAKPKEEIYSDTEYKEEETFLNNLINFRKNLE
jgi:hypothetical protein